MAGREREVRVTILGDSKGGQRALSQLDAQADKTDSKFAGLGGKLASFGKVAALGLGAAAVGVGAFLKSSVEAAEESRKVMAQTDAVIKSTGGVARVTAGDVDKLASSLSAMSGVDDELIAGGQNLLLTFTKVRNEVGKGNDIFNQGTKAALDMSVALGTDMNSASMLVGKALNDPIKGMTALTRSGIQFTDQQKEQVKAMVAAGDTLGAQKIILAELETQFGGSAAAAASPMERLKVVVGNLQEELGARFLPVIEKVATFLANNLPPALDAIGLVAGPVLAAAFNTISTSVGVAKTAFDAIIGVLQNPVFQVVAGIIVALMIPSLVSMGLAAAGAGAQVVFWWVAMHTQAIAATAGTVAQMVIQGAKWVWMGITALASAAQVAAAWLIAMGPIALVVAAVVGAAVLIVRNWDWIKETIGNVISTVIGFFGRLVSAVAAKAGELIGWVAGIPGRVLGALGNLGSLLWDAGADLLRGMINGLRSMAGRLADAALAPVRAAVNAVKGFLRIGSPSKLFEGFGVNIGEGLAGGMGRATDSVARAGDSLAAASVPRAGGLSSIAVGAAGGAPGAGITVVVNVAGTVVSEHNLIETIHAGLLRKQRRVPGLALT